MGQITPRSIANKQSLVDIMYKLLPLYFNPKVVMKIFFTLSSTTPRKGTFWVVGSDWKVFKYCFYIGCVTPNMKGFHSLILWGQTFFNYCHALLQGTLICSTLRVIQFILLHAAPTYLFSYWPWIWLHQRTGPASVFKILCKRAGLTKVDLG